MFQVLARLGRWLSPRQERKRRSRKRETRAAALTPTLQVRLLEERRVFHAGAVAAPTLVQQQPPPPPPPATTITLDGGQNLLVQDASSGGQNDQLAIRYDAAHSRYVIASGAQTLFTDIAGASGSGTNRVFIPVAAVAGGQVIFATGDGNDSLSVDLSQGIGGKSLVFDGGAGTDAVTLSGGSFGSVNYLFGAGGTTQIQAGPATTGSLVELKSVEPVRDQLAAGTRQFTIGAGASATLSDDGIAGNGLCQLTTSLGQSVVFATPQLQLSLDAGATGRLVLGGTIDLGGANLSARAAELEVGGTIVSERATIDLAATSTLTVTASGVIDSTAGRVLLDAGAGGTLTVSGRIDVSSGALGQVGGTVHLLGREVKLQGGAAIEASGYAGGGTVLVGGDFQGLNPLVRRATNTLIASGASIHADALVDGRGGKIIVWADEVALVAGSGNLQARGGLQGGDGGLIETSGKRFLSIGGAADAGSPLGLAGTWLLDPYDVDIVAGSGGTIPPSGDFTPAANTSIGADTIVAALATTNVTIYTGTGGNNNDGDITVSSAISVALGAGVTRTLTFNAARNVIVSANIVATSGSLNVVLNANSTAGGQADPDNTVGSVTVSGAITTNGGNFTSTGLNFTNSGAIATGAGTITLTQAGDISLGGNITSTAAATVTTTNGNIAFSGATTLTAASATLSATGTITSGTGGVDIDTSAANGAISLTGDLGIGTSANRILVQAASGVVSAATDDANGDIYLASSGSLRLGAVSTKLGAQTVNIRANINATDDIAIAATSTTDDNWTLLAADSIDFVGAVTVTAGSADLTATAGAISADTAATHLDTSAAGGAVTLTSATGIGSVSQALTVAADAGVVKATTGDASIYLASTSDLTLGAVVTAANANTVSITANATAGLDINIQAASATDDNWTLTASGNIALVGNVSVAARSATLVAGGTLTSGTGSVDIDTHDYNGAISLTGAQGIGVSGNRFRVRADDGTVTLATTAAAGHIYLLSTDSLDLGPVTTATGAQTVDILANLNSNDTVDLEVSNVTDDDWVVRAGDDISFVGGVTLTARSASLTSDGGAVLGGTAARDIVASASIAVDADSIGTAADALVLQPGSGTVSLSTDNGAIDVAIETLGAGFQTSQLSLARNTTLLGSDVTLTVLDGQLTLNGAAGFQSLANDDVTLATGGTDNIIHLASATTFDVKSLTLDSSGTITSASNAAVLTTGLLQSITLIGDSIGALAAPIVVQPGGTMSVTSAGDIYLRRATGGLDTSAFTVLTSTGAGGTVSIGTLAGNVNVDGTSGFSGLADDTLVIQAAGAGADIVFDTTLTAGDMTLIAADAIISDNSSNADLDTSAVDGDIVLSAGGQIGASGNELRLTAGDGLVAATTTTAGGHIYLLSMGDLQLGTVTTDAASTQTVQIGTTTGNLTLTVDNTSNDNVRLRAAGDLIVADDVTTTALTFTDLRAGGAIVSGGTGTIDFATTGLATDVLTITGGSVGTEANPLHVDHEGKYALTATGDLWLLIADGDLHTIDINSVTMPTAGTTLGLITAGGSIWVDSNVLGGLGSQELHLEARGAGSNINLDPSAGTLTFAAVTLLAEEGAIKNLNAGLAIDTSAAGGDITLRTLGAIGANGSPVVVKAGGGQVSATTTGPSGDIYLRSQSQLHLGLIDAEDPGVQTIQLTSDLGIDVDGVSATEDNWQLIALSGDIDFEGVGALTANSVSLSASGNINFNGTGGIVANSATLVAGGNITSTGAATSDVDTSGGAGVIHLEAGGIGTSGDRVAILPGTGSLEVIASTGDIYLQVNSNGLAMSKFTALTLTPNHTFDLLLTSGNLTVDVPIVLASADIALRTSGASGNIEFQPTGQVDGLDVTLVASGEINAADFTTVDVIADGDISLTGNLGIGDSGAPIVVRLDGAGDVSATTTTGDVYVFSPVALNLSSVTTSAALQAVDVRSGADLVVSDASTTDDNWTLAANGDLRFSGAASVTANNFTGVAGNLLLSGAAGSDVVAGGVVTLTAGMRIGAAGNGLAVITGSAGRVDATTLNAADGSVFLASEGLLRIGQITTPLGADVVNIADQNSTSEFEIVGLSSTDDNWTLDSGGNVAFVNSGGVVARTFTADADGNITSGTAAIDINTSPFGGIIDLDAGGGIGTQANPLAVSAWPAPVRAIAQTDDVYLTSPGHLFVDQAAAGGADPDVSLVTTGALSQILATVNSLNDDQWHLVATGDISLQVSSSVQWSQIEDLRSTSAGRSVFVSTDSGPMLVNTVHAGVLTADDNLTLLAWSGDIEFTNAARLTAANANLLAFNGSILGPGATTRIDVTTGALLLVAGGASGTIGSASDAFVFSTPELNSFATQAQWLAAADPTRLIQVETSAPGGEVSLVHGTFYLATSSSLPPNTPSVETTTLHVEQGALLGGSGIVQGTLHVLDKGLVNMGFGNDQAGLLRVQGNIVFDAGSELVVDINSPYVIPGRDYDHVQVTGDVFLNNSTLTLRGAQDLRVTINPLILFDLAPGMTTTGAFAVDNISLFLDGSDVRARVGQFRGKLSYFGGNDGNDIILNDLSLVPPVQRTGFRLPPPKIPVFTRSEQLPVVVQPPPPLTTSVETPVVEVEAEAVGIRYLEIRIAVPIDEAGNVSEVFAMKLPAEWLSNLPAILQQLPDDRYRIYLILEGGSEERLVMDVLVRDGRPVEPTETPSLDNAAAETPAAEARESLPPAPSEPAALPALPDLQPLMQDEQPRREPGAGRLYAGASAALAAVVAGRKSSSQRVRGMDDAAEAIARGPEPRNSRWWRFGRSSARPSTPASNR